MILDDKSSASKRSGSKIIRDKVGYQMSYEELKSKFNYFNEVLDAFTDQVKSGFNADTIELQ